MREATQTVDPRDDRLHPVGPEPDWMETNYYNFFDSENRLGGFLRLGNRLNEGWAEMTTCLFLPGRNVAFMFGRPRISGNDSFDAGGMRLAVVEPFKEQHLRYEGQVAILDDPTAMADPKAAFMASTHVDCRADFVSRGICEPWQPPEVQGRQGEGTGHNEQFISVEGSLTVGDEQWQVDGFGVRDHSWGPRTWHKVFRYGRWLTGPLARDFAFMGFLLVEDDGTVIDRGFVWDGTTFHMCDRFAITSTEYVGDYYQDVIEATLGVGHQEWKIHGKVHSVIPLRHRREGHVSRIVQGLTEWIVDGERSGYGFSEYDDQVVDGRPVSVVD